MPFIYVPLRNHFEQNFDVRARLDRYGAGRHMEYEDMQPDKLVDPISNEIGSKARGEWRLFHATWHRRQAGG